jgi:uncharacterized membrane protein
MNKLARYFLHGLLVVVPVLATLYLVYAAFRELNGLLFTRLGAKVSELIPFAESIVPVVGFVTFLTLVTLIGMITSSFLGRQIVTSMERLFDGLPLVKLLYKSLKDLLGAFVGDKKSFNHPVAVSLTADGSAKALGFVTQKSLERFDLADHVAVYLPQSYNFAGNLVVVPKDRVEALEVNSSDLMTFLISGGVSTK